MPAVPFENTEFAIRSDIRTSHIEAWGKIASPGTWLDSKRRLAVAAEIRRAQSCVFCMEIKKLSFPIL